MTMERIAVFCLYAKKGKLSKPTIFTLRELKKCSKELIVVVNGSIESKEELMHYADRVIVRENRGYDIAAYKKVLFLPGYIEKIRKSGEIIFCNSSFYGPFIPFEDIFRKMEDSSADFWGISSAEKNMICHIQSYFMVFRRRVLEGEEFYSYIRDKVNERNADYFGVCSVFENGLFHVLKNAGYQFDSLKSSIDYDSYRRPYASVKADHLPILKKKIFSKEFYNREQAVSALWYIKNHYDYDVSDILEDVAWEYGVEIGEGALKECCKITEEDKIFVKPEMVKREEIEQFIEMEEQVYLYGNGKTAQDIYSLFFFYEDNPKLGGFIISDDQMVTEREFRGYPVYKVSELDISDKAVLVSLNKENTKAVMGYLKRAGTVKILWKNL